MDAPPIGENPIHGTEFCQQQINNPCSLIQGLFIQNFLVFFCVERVEFSYMRKIIARTRAEFVNEAAGKEHTRHAKKAAMT